MLSTFSDLTSVSIKNLKPYTEYQFSVRSHSEDEKGPYGKLVIVRTNEGGKLRMAFLENIHFGKINLN